MLAEVIVETLYGWHALLRAFLRYSYFLHADTEKRASISICAMLARVYQNSFNVCRGKTTSRMCVQGAGINSRQLALHILMRFFFHVLGARVSHHHHHIVRVCINSYMRYKINFLIIYFAIANASYKRTPR